MLREEACPMPVVRRKRHHVAFVHELAADLVPRNHASNKVGSLIYDLRVLRVEHQTEPLRSGRANDVAVAEVQTEKLRIVRRRDVHRRRRLPTARTQRPRPSRVARRAPISHRLARDAEATGDLAVVQTRCDEVEGRLTNRTTMHEHMFALTADVSRLLR